MTPVLVFLTDTFIPRVTVKDKPDGVIILDRLDLPRYFRKRTPRLTASEVEQVFEFADGRRPGADGPSSSSGINLHPAG